MLSSLAGVLIVVLSCSLPKSCLTRHSYIETKNVTHSHALTIVGGRESKITKFPYTVSVSYNGSLLGSGAIVNRQWIVCSAGQLESYEKVNLTIRAGSDYSTSGGQVFYTDKIFIHKSYTGDFPYNVAAIKLNRPLQFGAKAKPVKIAMSVPKSGCKAVITGWGKQTVTDYSDKLQMAHVNVKTVGECYASHPTVDMTKVICADADGIGPCYGDEGDPLVCGKKLLGHFLGGNECNLLQDFDLYSNLSLYRKWVMQTIKHNSVGDESEGIEIK